MKKDSRLRSNTAGGLLYWERQKVRRQELDASVPANIWEIMVRPLVKLLVSKISNAEALAPKFPPNGDLRFQEAFESTRALITDFHPLHFDDDHGSVLVRHVAAAAAIELPLDADIWVKAAMLFNVSEDWAAFLDSIPVRSIESKIDELVESPVNLQDCFHSVNVTPEHLVSGEKQPTGEMWDRVTDRKKLADYCSLGHQCEVRCEILYRSSVANWVRWIVNLPHPVIQVIAMEKVCDLDFLEAVLEQVLNWHPSRTDELFLLALIRRLLDLWTEIESGFEKKVRERLDDAAEMKGAWESELSVRIERIIGLLARNEYGVTTAGVFFERLSPFRGPLFERIACLDSFRNAILSFFVGRGVDWDSTLLFQHPAVPSLTSATALVLQLPSEKGFCFVLERYLTWLSNSEYIWYESFKPHDKELLAGLAAVLAKSDDPIGKATNILDAVREPSQGWKMSLDRWLQSLPKSTHAIVMIALAASSVVDQEGRNEKSAALMGLAWREFHEIVEGSPVELAPNQICSPLAYIWGCAGKAFAGGDEERSFAVRMLEDPELVLIAAKNLEANGSLSDTMKDVVWEHTESLLVLFHHARNFAKEREGPIRQELAELIGTESRSNVPVVE